MSTYQLLGVQQTESNPRVNSIAAIRQLSDAEYEVYRSSCRVLNEFDHWQALIQVAIANYDELQQTLAECRTFRPRRNPKSELRDLLHLTINRRLVNFLATGRLFTDHTEVRLARKFGKQSEHFKTFKRVTGEKFDTVFAYRFFCGLRNYSLHSGMPVLGISQSSRVTESGTEEHIVEFSFNSSELLARGEGYWHRLVKRDLASGPPELPVADLAAQYVHALVDINSAVVATERDRLHEAGRHILEIVKDASDHGSMPAVGIVEEHEDGDGMQFHIEDVPFEMLARLGLVKLVLPDGAA